MRAVAGALFGAMMGLLVAKEFTETMWIVLPASMAGSMLGIVLSFLLPRREDSSTE